MAAEDPASYLQLISLAVHEFRTPASVVSGYLRMLQRDAAGPLSAQQRKMIDEAERSCQRLAALVTELSDIQKLDAERVDLNQEAFDLFAIVGDVARDVLEVRDRDVPLEIRGPADGATMRGDAARMRRALAAVFRAILREMPDNTRVVGERRITADNGMRSALLIVAAEPNVQASYTAVRGEFDEKRGGLGLALPFARRIIERHGGQIWSPEPHTKGAAIVSLPLSEPKT
jgi:signal transduction histidine kinase